MPYSVDALRQWTIPVAPGVVLSKGEFVFQSKDSQGLAAGPSASRSGDVEFHVVCGGGFFLVPGSQPGVEVQSNFFKTTLDPSGQVTAPKFVLGPEEGLNTFVVETLYASHDVHVVGTYDTTVLEVLAPVGADLEQVARRPNGRQVDVVVLAKEKAYNSAPVPNLLLEMEVVNGACGFVYEGMGHYGILATGDDGKLKAELNLGNRKDLVRVQISGYRNRNVAGATFDINVRTPALNNPDSSNDLGSLPLLSAAPPVRPSVSDARTKAVSASDVAQPNLLIHCETPNANVVELHGTENSSGGWGSTTIAHPRQPGAFELDLRLPDFPDTETLKIKGVGKSPLDTGLISISQLPAYIEATRAGDRDGHFGISGQVKNDAIRYLGPSREVAQPFIVEIDLFKGTGNEAIVEMDLDFKVRAAPINSSVDDPSPASKDMIPGKIRVTEIQIPSGIFPSYTAHPPFVIHPPITIRPPISIPVGGVTPKPPPSGGPAPVPPAGAGWVDEVKEVLTQLRPYTYKVEFQSSAKNRDNLVEITAVAKVLVTDPNGVTSVVSRQTNLTLRLAALQPRIYFVREAAPGKFVPILDSSIIPVTYFKADGTPESIPKDAQFFVEVLSDDVGTSLDCWIFAGHQIKVPASRVQFALQYSRYRTAAYTVYLDNDNGGQTVAPPPLPFIHSAGANTLRAFVDNPNYPGKDEIGTPDRPMTSFQLIQVGDALQRDRIIAPKLHIDTNVDATWNTMAAGTDAIVEVRGWVRDFFADLSSAAAPTQVLVNGATVPLAGAAETKSYGRPFAWKGSFSAKIKVPLGVQVITIRVENAMKAATERRFLAEVGTRPNVLAGGTSFVTSVREIGGGQKHPAPFLQYLCVRAGSLGATLAPPPPFSARVSALAPYPATGAVGTPLKLTMSPLPGTTATYYRSDLFYTLPADLVAPTGLPTGTTGLAVPRGGRLEWEATAIPNLLRPIHLLNRLEFWSLAQTIRRKTPAGWEVARQINTGDTITVEVQEYPPKHRGQLQLQLRFQDPTGLFSDNPDHVLSFDANETNPAQGIYTMSDVNTRGNVGQTSPATEVVVLGDAADAPLGGGYIRVRAVGQMVVGGAVYPVDPVPVFAKPKRYVVNGAPMPQETYRVAVPRLGACGSVVPGTGELVFVETDRAVPGRQYDVQFSRTYRSGNDYESSLGFGWSPSWNVFLWRESRERIRMFSDAAMLVDFVRGASGWESPDGIYAKLEEDAAGFFRLRTRVGQFMTFAPVGGLEGLYYVLVTMEDRFGNRMRQSYAAHGGVFRIVDMMGRNFALHHDVITRRLAGLGDYSGSDVKFGMYGANDPNGVAGSLLTVRSPIITNPDNPFPAGRTTSYSYYLAPDQHRLHVRTDPKNGTIAMTYDANGHVSEQAHGKGKYVFSPQGTSLTWYDRKKQARQLQFAPSSPGFAPFLKSTVNHVRGRDVTHSYLYNRHGEMTRHDFPAGNAEQLAFDENANDPRDRGNLKDRWLFPSKGSELVTRTVGVYDPKVDPQPVAIQSIHESFEYEPGLQLLIRHKDALGRETRHVYKGGVLQKSVYPTVSKGGAKGVLQSRERSYEWNELGQLTAEVDPNGVTTRYTYFPDSDPIGA
ncbi:MAG: hypothetical protein HY075_14620, partial [Deltaproteobacteria bacterium]|nr:hypothetical protein [Deltaproteobacteria bacterium]